MTSRNMETADREVTSRSLARSRAGWIETTRAVALAALLAVSPARAQEDPTYTVPREVTDAQYAMQGLDAWFDEQLQALFTIAQAQIGGAPAGKGVAIELEVEAAGNIPIEGLLVTLRGKPKVMLQRGTDGSYTLQVIGEGTVGVGLGVAGRVKGYVSAGRTPRIAVEFKANLATPGQVSRLAVTVLAGALNQTANVQLAKNILAAIPPKSFERFFEALGVARAKAGELAEETRRRREEASGQGIPGQVASAALGPVQGVLQFFASNEGDKAAARIAQVLANAPELSTMVDRVKDESGWTLLAEAGAPAAGLDASAEAEVSLGSEYRVSAGERLACARFALKGEGGIPIGSAERGASIEMKAVLSGETVARVEFVVEGAAQTLVNLAPGEGARVELGGVTRIMYVAKVTNPGRTFRQLVTELKRQFDCWNGVQDITSVLMPVTGATRVDTETAGGTVARLTIDAGVFKQKTTLSMYGVDGTGDVNVRDIFIGVP